MRATLTKVLTKDAFARMIPAAERWTAGVQKAITEFGVPWHVTRLGCRAEYQFSPTPPKNGAAGPRCHGFRTGALHALCTP